MGRLIRAVAIILGVMHSGSAVSADSPTGEREVFDLNVDAAKLPPCSPMGPPPPTWQGVKFCSSQQEVRAHLESSGDGFRARSTLSEGGGIGCDKDAPCLYAKETTLTMAGLPMSAVFQFYKDKLIVISVRPNFLDEYADWAARMALQLRGEYGAPSGTNPQAKVDFWDVDGVSLACCSILYGLNVLYEDALRAAKAEIQASGAVAEAEDKATQQTLLKMKKPRAEWLKEGWGPFKWGMGPADVAERLRPAKLEPRGGAAKPGDVAVFFADPSQDLLGRLVSAFFRFRDGRLTEVGLTLRHPNSSPASTQDEEWAAKLREGIAKKYGPKCKMQVHRLSEGSVESALCSPSPTLEVSYSVQRLPGLWVMVEYRNPRATPKPPPATSTVSDGL